MDLTGLSKVSDSKEEEPVPDINSYIFQPSIPMHIQPSTNDASGSNSVKLSTHANYVTHLGERIDVTEQLGNADWQALIRSQDQLPNLKSAKSDYVDYSVIGPAFRLEEASKNAHELDPTVIPSALKQMAHCRVFIPLSMFTTQALHKIRDNIGDLYTKKKTGLSAGKYILNSDCFLDENTLTEQTFFQAYRNWLRLLSDVADPEVAKGWNWHHDLMINDANFSSSFVAWKAHDRNLRTSFFNAPFMLDIDSRSYTKGFDREWMASEVSSFRKERSNSPSDSRSFRTGSSQNRHTPNNNSANNASSRFAPYDKHASDSFRDNRQQTLCLRCSLFGHRANACMSSSPSKPSRSFIVEWKDNKLVSIKSNKSVCVMFNVRGSCTLGNNPHHGDHSCSFCADPKHGAAACTRN